MASAKVMADGPFVCMILQQLSNMTWRDRVQPSPEQRVELHEYRPTLVPSILVNKLWASAGRSILWKRYPPLPALAHIAIERRQLYADMIESLFVRQPSAEEDEDFDFLASLDWSNLKNLDLELDWTMHERGLKRTLHPGLETVELVGVQQRDSRLIAQEFLPHLFRSCENLQSIHLSPTTIDPANPTHHQALIEVFDIRRSIKSIRLFDVSVFGKDHIFTYLSQGFGQLEELELDLEPGLQLLPMLTQRPSTFYPALKRLQIMCYPEIAPILSSLLPLLEELHMDIARIPDQTISQSDLAILDDMMTSFDHCPRLKSLRLDVGPLAMDFPSSEFIPSISGTSLIHLANSCPHLEHLALSASEPAAIDASKISPFDFDTFCGLVKNLRHLSLKFDPITAVELSVTALPSLSRYCPNLEVLRMRAPLQLTSLDLDLAIESLDIATDAEEASRSAPAAQIPSIRVGEVSDPSTQSTTPPSSFPNLIHLASSRPNTILSRTSSPIDPSIAADLVQPFASSMLTHFPNLEILEAWSDYLGADKDSLNYFLPLKEPLASSWEFLSGREQNLYEDDEGMNDEGGGLAYCYTGFDYDELDEREVERWDGDFEEGETSFESSTSGDWDLASKMNEFHVEHVGIPDLNVIGGVQKEVLHGSSPTLGGSAWADDITAVPMDAEKQYAT